MGKSVRRRVLESFPSVITGGDEDEGGPAVNASEYAEKILSAWKDTSSVLRKSVTLIFFLMGIFELLAYQSSSKGFTVAGFAFADSPVVLIILPVIIGYLVFDSYLNTKQWLDLERAYRALTMKSSSLVYKNELDLLLRPPLPPMWTIGSAFSSENATTAEQFIYKVTALTRTLAVIVLPLIFECQAYYHLFHSYGFKNPLLWSSAVVTFALSICYGIILGLSSSVDNDDVNGSLGLEPTASKPAPANTRNV
jgi:hypothetical protein